MSRNEQIAAGLKAVGVPISTFKTTLVLQGAPDLHEMVLSGKFRDQTNPLGVFMYPRVQRDATRARTLFGLMAKETYLSGTRVAFVSVSDMFLGTREQRDDRLMDKADEAAAVFLVDFYEAGAAFPYGSEKSAFFRSWVRRKTAEGASVSFLSDTSPEKITGWWSPSFLAFIQEATYEYCVGSQG
jgi:hypothetical protein